MNTRLMTIIIIALCIAPFVAPAEDLQRPWWRGEWSTTSQYWEFLDPFAGPIPPDGIPEGGRPYLDSTEVTVDGHQWLIVDQVYNYEYEGQTGTVGIGVWQLSGAMEVIVDNHDPNPENEKWLWVQLTWRPTNDPAAAPDLVNLFPAPVNAPRVVEEIFLGPPDDPLGWRETTYAWELDHNPPDEMFTIMGDISVDELVIDTWCVPEPGVFALAGLGLLALLRRRKKRSGR